MAGIKVDPPPLAVQVVDPVTGYPTRALSDFLYRLWERSGGNDDASDFIVKLMTGLKSQPSVNPVQQDGPCEQVFQIGGGVGHHEINEIIGSAVVMAMQSKSDNTQQLLEAILSVGVMVNSITRSHSSEIAELKKEIESVRAMVSSMAFVGTKSYSGI